MLLEPTGMDRLVDPSIKPRQCACGTNDPLFIDHSLKVCRYYVSYSYTGTRQRHSYLDYLLQEDYDTNKILDFMYG